MTRESGINFTRIERTLAMSFGVVIFILMGVVFFSSIFYFTHVIHAEQDRLGSIIANSVGDSINRVSFSGKYQARLLVEDLKKKNPNIHSISLEDETGLIVAHSDPSKNGQINYDSKNAKNKGIDSKLGYSIGVVSSIEDGRKIDLIEIKIPYRKGYQAEQAGVIHVFLSTTGVDNAIDRGLIFFSIMALVLTLLAMIMVSRLSRHFGSPIKKLAYQLQGIMDYAPIVMYINDKNDSFITMSSMFKELSEKLVSKSIISSEHGFVAELEINDFVFKSGTPSSFDYMYESAESVRYFHATKYPIAKDDKEDIALICTIAIDITARIVAESELGSLNKTLEDKINIEIMKRREQEQLLIQQAKLASMGDMIGAIAHQWRQPLNALGIIVQDVKYAHAANEVNKDYIDDMSNSAMRQINFMSKTIDDFRRFFAPSKNRIDFNVKMAVGEVVSLLEPQMTNNGISVKLTSDESTDDSQFVISGYPNEFKQVIVNLLSNAKDAIESSENDSAAKNGMIKIDVSRDDGHIVVNVHDSGDGVPVDLIDRIFEPYYTTKEQGKGTGVGLYMSKVIIENNMNGNLGVRNSDEGGAIFTIKIACVGGG